RGIKLKRVILKWPFFFKSLLYENNENILRWIQAALR
ncbi:MAG: hypothetical protein ACJAYM_002436, partial [Flavobacteriales bacterium]